MDISTHHSIVVFVLPSYEDNNIHTLVIKFQGSGMLINFMLLALPYILNR